MKRKWLILCLIEVFAFAILFYIGIQRTYKLTFTTRNGTTIKSEQIQPLFRTVSPALKGKCFSQ